MIKKILDLLKIDNFKDYKIEIILSLYLSMAITSLLNVIDFNNLQLTSFKRAIGQGIIGNYDCEKLIQSFYLQFIIMALLAVMFFLIIRLFINKNQSENNVKAWKCIKSILPIAFANLFLKSLKFFDNDKNFDFGFLFLFIFIIVCVFYIIANLGQKINFDYFQWSLILIFIISFSVSLCISSNISFGIEWMLLFCTIILLFCVSVFFNVFEKIPTTIYKEGILHAAGVFGSLFFFTSVFVESLSVLNQYEIFIVNKKLVLLVIIGILAIAGVVVYFILNKTRLKMRWQAYLYPMILFGMACMAVQPALQTIGNYSIFESANYSVLISDFLNHGRMPIVSHYGGHMLTNFLGGISYGIINNDYAGAIFAPYAAYIYPIVVTIFYYFLKNILSSRQAFWFILVITCYDSYFYFGVGLLICLALIKYMERHTFGRAFCIWFCCIITTLYKLDLGVAFGVATLIVLTVYTIQNREFKQLKTLFGTLIISIVSTFIIFCILCFRENINPIKRIFEFISISLSNQNWAYGTIGDPQNLGFYWVYLFLPIICMLGILYLIFNKEIKVKVNYSIYYFLLFLGFSYFINFSRGLVRHSMNEYGISITQNILMFTSTLFLAILISVVKNKSHLFIYTIVLLSVLNILLIGNSKYNETSLVNGAINNNNKIFEALDSTNKDIFDEKVNRVVWPEELVTNVSQLNIVLDTLLTPEETYIDFVNKSFMYSALNRESPVYIAQSPIHLSGEYAQEQFIEQIEENTDNTPIVLMPSLEATDQLDYALDGISHSVRYYKVAEYIYQNFRPLFKVNDIAIWCRIEKYEEYQMLNRGWEKIDWGYDVGEMGDLHGESLHDLPYLWGNLDVKKGWENQILYELKNMGTGKYQMPEIDLASKVNGNYLLISGKIEDADFSNPDSSNTIKVSLGITNQIGKVEPQYSFRFNGKVGTDHYLIRISSDYFWYIGNIDTIIISSELQLSDIELKILEGD